LATATAFCSGVRRARDFRLSSAFLAAATAFCCGDSSDFRFLSASAAFAESHCFFSGLRLLCHSRIRFLFASFVSSGVRGAMIVFH
jgi:hypothetical protein